MSGVATAPYIHTALYKHESVSKQVIFIFSSPLSPYSREIYPNLYFLSCYNIVSESNLMYYSRMTHVSMYIQYPSY